MANELVRLRAECIALGIQPGRSVAECARRIDTRRASIAEQQADAARIKRDFAQIGAWPQGAILPMPDRVHDAVPSLRRRAPRRKAPTIMAPKPRLSAFARQLMTSTALRGCLADYKFWVGQPWAPQPRMLSPEMVNMFRLYGSEKPRRGLQFSSRD